MHKLKIVSGGHHWNTEVFHGEESLPVRRLAFSVEAGGETHCYVDLDDVSVQAEIEGVIRARAIRADELLLALAEDVYGSSLDPEKILVALQCALLEWRNVVAKPEGT